MSEAATKVSVKTSQAAATKPQTDYRPLQALRTQVDRLFEDFQRGFLPGGGDLAHQLDKRPAEGFEDALEILRRLVRLEFIEQRVVRRRLVADALGLLALEVEHLG